MMQIYIRLDYSINKYQRHELKYKHNITYSILIVYNQIKKILDFYKNLLKQTCLKCFTLTV